MASGFIVSQPIHRTSFRSEKWMRFGSVGAYGCLWRINCRTAAQGCAGALCNAFIALAPGTPALLIIEYA
jgi:hypothetical protein